MVKEDPEKELYRRCEELKNTDSGELNPSGSKGEENKGCNGNDSGCSHPGPVVDGMRINHGDSPGVDVEKSHGSKREHECDLHCETGNGAKLAFGFVHPIEGEGGCHDDGKPREAAKLDDFVKYTQCCEGYCDPLKRLKLFFENEEPHGRIENRHHEIGQTSLEDVIMGDRVDVAEPVDGNQDSIEKMDPELPGISHCLEI